MLQYSGVVVQKVVSTYYFYGNAAKTELTAYVCETVRQRNKQNGREQSADEANEQCVMAW